MREFTSVQIYFAGIRPCHQTEASKNFWREQAIILDCCDAHSLFRNGSILLQKSFCIVDQKISGP